MHAASNTTYTSVSHQKNKQISRHSKLLEVFASMNVRRKLKLKNKNKKKFILLIHRQFRPYLHYYHHDYDLKVPDHRLPDYLPVLNIYLVKMLNQSITINVYLNYTFSSNNLFIWFVIVSPVSVVLRTFTSKIISTTARTNKQLLVVKLLTLNT